MKNRTNTADNYIYHLYRKHYTDLNEAYNKLTTKVDFKVGTAYGNYQIDIKDVFTDNGPENLRYRNVGYGKVSFMGTAIYFDNKKQTDLYYKSQEYKDAVENFIIVVDILCGEKRENVHFIEKQHGRPKVEHSIIWMMASKNLVFRK